LLLSLSYVVIQLVGLSTAFSSLVNAWLDESLSNIPTWCGVYGAEAFALARLAVVEPGFWNMSCCVITYDESTDIKGLTMPHCLIEAAREVCELIAPQELL
jgi:hypothetical protein